MNTYTHVIFDFTQSHIHGVMETLMFVNQVNTADLLTQFNRSRHINECIVLRFLVGAC